MGLHIVFWNDTVYNNSRRKTILEDVFTRRYQVYSENRITYKIQKESAGGANEQYEYKLGRNRNIQ